MDSILHKQKKPSTQLQPAFPPLFLPNSSCTCHTMSFLFLALTTCRKNPVRSSSLSNCYICFPQSRSKITWAVSARCAARVLAHPEPRSSTALPILTTCPPPSHLPLHWTHGRERSPTLSVEQSTVPAQPETPSHGWCW